MMEKNAWLLVVEDNEDDEYLTRRAFSSLQRPERLVVARSGEEALQVLRQNPLPVCVLLDLKLPRLSGVDVLMAMKDDEQLRVIPVIILTTSNERVDMGACYDLGCNAFVRKPIDFEEFVHTLSVTITFWLGVNQTLSRL